MSRVIPVLLGTLGLVLGGERAGFVREVSSVSEVEHGQTTEHMHELTNVGDARVLDEYPYEAGTVFGAAIGDALGGPLEFYKGTAEETRQAITLAVNMETVDGRDDLPHTQWSLKPGEVTDDTAMAMCLARALSEYNSATLVNVAEFQKSVVPEYMEWANGPPFDIGRTTSEVLQKPSTEDPSQDVTNTLQRAVDQNTGATILHGSGTLSNGVMMRIAAMAVWLSSNPLVTQERFEEAIRADCFLTNANEIACTAVTAYCTLIRNLLRADKSLPEQQRANNALIATRAWLEVKTSDSRLNVPYLKGNPEEKKNAAVIVLEWFDASTQDIDRANPPPGWISAVSYQQFLVSVAFQRTINMLHRAATRAKALDYRQEMTWVISEGGDTDTNACIVGGVMGALKGIHAIDEGFRYLRTMTALKGPYLHPSRKADPDKYQPKHYLRPYKGHPSLLRALIEQKNTKRLF